MGETSQTLEGPCRPTKKLSFQSTARPEQVLALKEASLPDKVPADHYRIAVKASPVNPADRIFIEGHFLGQHGAKLPTILKEILDHLASGKLTLEHKEFDLVKEWQQALFHCKTGSKGGKTVITNP